MHPNENPQSVGDCGCHGECTPPSAEPESNGDLRRREFLRHAALAGGAAFLSRPAFAGPFKRDERLSEVVPADKKLDPTWVQSLFDRGAKTTYTDPEALKKIGMPVGGFFAGTLYLGGDGRLWLWDILNRDQEGIDPRPFEENQGNNPLLRVSTRAGLNYLHPAKPKTLFEQGFWIQSGGSRRSLDSDGFSKVRFDGRYPIGRVNYQDAESPLEVDLEAYSPFCPLSLDDSSLPATVMSYRVKNTSDKTVTGSMGGHFENPVCHYSKGAASGQRVHRIWRDGALTALEMTARDLEAETSNRKDILVADFEGESYEGWTVEGEAFGKGPVLLKDVPDYQGDVNGVGKRVVNSHATAPGDSIPGKDGKTGKLTSDPFVLKRHYLRFRIGGGGHKGTSLRVLVDGKVVARVSGRSHNRMLDDGVDLRRFEGKKARIEIVDEVRGAWGNIGVDHIVQSDQAPPGKSVTGQFDFGSLSLVLLDGDETKGTANRQSSQPATEAEASLQESLVGELSSKFELKPGESKTFRWLVTWHFPNLNIRAMRGENLKPSYAARFKSSLEVATYVSTNWERLSSDTKDWVDTWYDSSLPYWFLDRTMANTSILATTTCYRMSDGHFWAWEGIGCCPGTCTHVWHYAQAPGRLFPELERDQRERVDFGLAYHKDGGVGHRSYLASAVGPAIDGHCGRILGVLREHQMSTDSKFLRGLWPKVKKAVEWLIRHDADQDGVVEGAQHNTLDAAWYGKISWISSLYLAALHAGAAMAKEMGEPEFATRCEKIAKRGEKSILETYDGEYFTQIENPKHHAAIGTGKGCHIDQVFGQTWANWVGLGRLFDREKQISALRALWKYNFVPDIGPFRKAFPRGRWYATAGDAGLVMCTWPKGGQRESFATHWQYGYFNECMTGFEWQAASHMIQESSADSSLLLYGLAISRAIHDRYDASLRNPYNEVECSDHYSRAMASYGAYQAVCGFDCHGPERRMTMVPRLQAEAFKAAFVGPEGWGTYEQTLGADGNLRVSVSVKRGRLRLKNLVCGRPNERFVAGKVNGEAAKLSASEDPTKIELSFPKELSVGRGQSVEFVIAKA